MIIKRALVISLLVLSGCSTWGVRVQRNKFTHPPFTVYPAVAGDFEGFAVYHDAAGLFYPFLVIDIPISAAFDTIFLPYDMYRVSKRDNPNPIKAVEPTRAPEGARGSP